MASPYDQNLLASVPKATKAQLQGGYNPDLLVEKTSSTPTTSALDPEVARLTPAQRQSEEALPLDKKKVPFYSTKKGIIILVVVAAVIVIAAVVGGAVGGTRHKKTSITTAPMATAPIATAPIATTSTTTSGDELGAPTSVGGQPVGSNSPPSPTSSRAPVITIGGGTS